MITETEETHCSSCNQQFNNSKSFQIHTNYEHKHLMKMWMHSDELSKEAEVMSPNNSGAASCHNSLSNNMYDDSSDSSTMQATSPCPSMAYDMQKNSNGMVSVGPPSGSNATASFPPPSPADCYDYTLLSNSHQLPYNNYHQPTFQSLIGEDGYKGYGSQRFQPYYIGRSPLPTPSPSASIISDIKEEPNRTPPHQDILDLDSQMFLTNGSNTTTTGSLLPIWRSRESYPTPISQTNGMVRPVEMNPIGIGANHSNVNGGSFMESHLPTSSYNPPPPATVTHSQPRHSYAQGSSVSTFFPQGLSAISINSQYAANPSVPPPVEDGPPQSEYPSNVKRAKAYKCIECNKWFTSHGHLKRHYNTTLHRNMVASAEVASSSGSAGSPAIKNSSYPKVTSPPTATIVKPVVKVKQETVQRASPDPVDVNPYQPAQPAFQPSPPVYQQSPYSGPYSLPAQAGNTIPSSLYNGLPGHINSTVPYGHHYASEQAPPPVYQGNFSTEAYSTLNGGIGHNRSIFGFPPNYPYHHAMVNNAQNEYANQLPVEAFNTFRLDSDKNVHTDVPPVLETATPSPIATTADSISESSPDSNESNQSATQPTQYKCGDCEKTFNRMCYLTQHRSTYHDGEKPYKCSTCGKKFTEECQYLEHETKHAGEKPYKCEMCPKQFNHKTDLRRHMCLHTGEKPFTCDICGKGFIRKDHMLKHCQTHRKKLNNANANSTKAALHPPTAALHPSPATLHPPPVAPISLPGGIMNNAVLPNDRFPPHMMAVLPNHHSPGVPTHHSPGIQSHTPIGIPNISPVAMSHISPVSSHPEYIGHHSTMPHQPHNVSGHSTHVVAPPVY